MDKKDWMQKWFMEYRENKRWCIDTSKGSVSRLDVLKDKCLWTKPGFDGVAYVGDDAVLNPTLRNVVDKRPMHEKLKVTITIDSSWTACGRTPDHVIKDVVEDYLRDVKAALRYDRQITDIKIAGYELCSDS